MNLSNRTGWKTFGLAVFAVVSLVTLPATVQAATITGTLGISGGVIYDTVNTTGGAVIDWRPADIGIGGATVITDATGYFNPDGFGPQGIDISPTGTTPGPAGGTATTLTIRDITNVASMAGAPPAPAYAPPGTVSPPVVGFLSNFVDNYDGVLAPLTNLRFDLTEVVRQTGFAPCTPAATLGTTCVLGDVFVVTQTVEGLRILLDVRGFFVNGADSGFFGGAFSTTFKGLTFQEAFARLSTGQDLTCPNGAFCTFDANFSAIPEPTTLLTFGTGAALLARRLRRRKA